MRWPLDCWPVCLSPWCLHSVSQGHQIEMWAYVYGSWIGQLGKVFFQKQMWKSKISIIAELSLGDNRLSGLCLPKRLMFWGLFHRQWEVIGSLNLSFNEWTNSLMSSEFTRLSGASTGLRNRSLALTLKAILSVFFLAAMSWAVCPIFPSCYSPLRPRSSVTSQPWTKILKLWARNKYFLSFWIFCMCQVFVKLMKSLTNNTGCVWWGQFTACW